MTFIAIVGVSMVPPRLKTTGGVVPVAAAELVAAAIPPPTGDAPDAPADVV